jgi:hypothetical protein
MGERGIKMNEFNCALQYQQYKLIKTVSTVSTKWGWELLHKLMGRYEVERRCSWCKCLLGYTWHDKPGETNGICNSCSKKVFGEE